MNIFILSENKEICAQYHCDSHIVKMPTETAQILSFAYYHNDLWDNTIPEFIMGFGKTHDKHPCSLWVRRSLSNSIYAAELGLELYNEYQYRYNKPDKHTRVKKIFDFCIENPPNISDIGLTEFVCAVKPEYMISDNPIENYRFSYKEDKKHLHRWTKREIPFFIQ